MVSIWKKFLKHIIQYNFLDYFTPYLRKFYRKLGILETMDHLTYRMIQKIGKWLILKKMWNVKVTGVENIPATDAGIIVANHSHLMDPVFIGGIVPRYMHWVSKIENYFHPFFRTLLQTTGSIPIRRGESDKNALRLIRKEIEKGEIVGIFPEGTRTRTGYINRFHTGSARFCIEYNIPYIPMGITGSFKCKLGDTIEIKVGKPVYPNKNTPLTYENAKVFTKQMKKDILKLSGKECLPESYNQPKNNKVKIPKGENMFKQIVRQQMLAARIFESMS